MILVSRVTSDRMMIQVTVLRERVQKTSVFILKMRKDPFSLYLIYSEFLVLSEIARFHNIQGMVSGLCLSELLLHFIWFKPRR